MDRSEVWRREAHLSCADDSLRLMARNLPQLYSLTLVNCDVSIEVSQAQLCRRGWMVLIYEHHRAW